MCQDAPFYFSQKMKEIQDEREIQGIFSSVCHDYPVHSRHPVMRSDSKKVAISWSPSSCLHPSKVRSNSGHPTGFVSQSQEHQTPLAKIGPKTSPVHTKEPRALAMTAGSTFCVIYSSKKRRGGPFPFCHPLTKSTF